MAKSEKRISVNAFEKQVNASKPENIITFMWGDIEVTVKRRLPLSEYVDFVEGVVKECFTKDDFTYLPEIKNFAINCNVLTKYANFTLPSSIHNQYELIYDSNAVSEVLKYVDGNQFDDIIDAIDAKIDAELRLGASMIQIQTSKLVAAISDLEEKFTEIFSGVDKGEMLKMIDAITDGKFDETRLISAYFDQKKRAENIEVTQNEDKLRSDSEES